ncbi:sensor histidine kinase [Actinomycetospora atypica]|uniref:histidine kinase n=1 Tax=Actinomycetospora atypica TaxID=1290095 RepID=A0ABV9YS03_9PSEU
MTTLEAPPRTEPAPRPALATAGVPEPGTPPRLYALARAARPLLWLGIAAGTLWPLTLGAVTAGLLVLAGAGCAVAAARDPRIPSPTGDGDRWRTAMLAACAVAGLAATALVPVGAAYAAVLVAGGLVGRVVLDARLIRGFAAFAGAALSVVFALAVGSSWGLLLGLAVPVLASRSLDRARLHREHTRVVALLAERDALREAELAGAAAQERARIARDLHDVLAHSLSGLSLHLQAIRAVLVKRDAPDDPVLASVDRAADLARAGLAEAKEAVAALRSTPAPTAADLRALADRHDATLQVTGDPDEAAPAVREALFATVREALTNAGRHAPGAPVRVTVAAGPEAVEATVTNPAGTGTSSGTGGGHGLAGLRERAALVGGTLEAGPDDEGWRVALRVPLGTLPT